MKPGYVSGFVDSTFTSQAGWNGFFTVVFWLMLVLLLANMVLLWRSRRWPGNHPRRELLGRMGKWGVAVGLLGLVALWFRYENALYLSAPLIQIGWVVVFFWWAWEGWKYRRRTYPIEMKKYEEVARKARWLPARKPKKKK